MGVVVVELRQKVALGVGVAAVEVVCHWSELHLNAVEEVVEVVEVVEEIGRL